MKKLLIALLSVLTMCCASHKPTNNEPSFVEIKFGNSGGFTGATNEYFLTPNGKVYKNTPNTFTLINQIEAAEVQAIETQIKELNFQEKTLNKTGNMTYFIEVNTTTYQNRVTWSNPSEDESIQQLYNTLVKTVKK